jgi:3'-phosphoadenosine 5'-phosphosulfate sulfotransferase (PAPS reductase)/FAD synthetase
MPTILVSCSGGKDSTATLLLSLEERIECREPKAVFADTGNEHPIVYEYLDYLGHQTGVTIHRLKPDFTDWWWRKRDYTRDKWPLKGVPADVVTRALAVFEKGPTGNPYLDLCIIKTRFPSRMAQFCTQYLKTEPLTEYALELIELHRNVESWQGVRADESASRAKLPEREDVGGGLTIYRPILKWSVEDVFAIHKRFGVKPNPLYSMGMGRVGCMPCINAAKDEVLEISKRFPEHIDRIAEWELIVGEVSKQSSATFFASLGTNDDAYERGNVRKVVQWAETARGGRQVDWIRLEPSEACSSSYGLCE